MQMPIPKVPYPKKFSNTDLGKQCIRTTITSAMLTVLYFAPKYPEKLIADSKALHIWATGQFQQHRNCPGSLARK